MEPKPGVPIVDSLFSGETGARSFLRDLESDINHALSSDSVALAPDDRYRLMMSLAQMRPAFDIMAEIFEPLRGNDPTRFKRAFIAVHQLLLGALHAGAFIVISDSARDYIKKPLKDGGARGGAISGETRRAKREKGWRAVAEKAIAETRRKNPALSQSRLADDVIAGWKDEAAPGHDALLLLIREMEKTGAIPKRRA